MSTADYQIDSFLTTCQLKQLSKKTLSSYQQTLKLFFRYMEDTYQIETSGKVKETHIASYIEELKTRGEYTVLADPKTDVYNHPTNSAVVN